jgi:hypothetical protein
VLTPVAYADFVVLLRNFQTVCDLSTLSILFASYQLPLTPAPQLLRATIAHNVHSLLDINLYKGFTIGGNDVIEFVIKNIDGRPGDRVFVVGPFPEELERWIETEMMQMDVRQEAREKGYWTLGFNYVTRLWGGQVLAFEDMAS